MSVGKEGEWSATKVSGLNSSKEIGCEGKLVALTIDEWLENANHYFG
jgi:hypothetical protein